MNVKNFIKDNNLEHVFSKGSFGIEKEGLRTNLDGKLALTKHPETVGSRQHHPYIQTDFSESQLELVTPPTLSLKEQHRWLVALHDVAHRNLLEDEFIWPFSMPNILPDEETIPIIDVEDKKEIQYREKLAEKYGKRKQMISGIHFNFSFAPDFTEKMSQLNIDQRETLDYLYLKLSRNFIRYQWLITYLYGASPVCHPSFDNGENQGVYTRSIRNSPIGYHNTFSDRVSYASVQSYVEDIERFVKEGQLIEEREYYGSARLRGKGKAARGLLREGVKYVELRSFDNNPFNSLGFTIEQSQFVHLFLLTMLWIEQNSTDDEIDLGMKQNELTAGENPFEPSQFKEEGLLLLDEMMTTAKELGLDSSYIKSVEEAIVAFEEPERTLAAQVVKAVEKEGSYMALGSKLGQAYKQESYEKPFLLRGFEQMEMSTQLLLFDALQLGIEVDILDEQDQFLKLTHDKHVEYVKNGNMTSKDTYISHWIMANKTVTKKILADEGYIIPGGEEFVSIEDALNHYPLFKDKAIVVKPKSTNYGIGISIFKNPPKEEGYKEALEIAFKEDSEVLVEEFIKGTEYRFFVVNGRTEAVLLREPANVVGDGEKTVAELIEAKNTHPYRGEKHRAPLEKIQMGQIESLMLKEQNRTFESVLEKGEKVFLRENSNISTGGDSVDVTDSMHESYKRIAEEMAEVLGVNVTGIDLIVPDMTKESTPTEPGYTVIEANFNPAMHMHAYVHEGKGRRLTRKVLDMLYPTIQLS